MASEYELTSKVKNAFCKKMGEMVAELRKSISLSQTECGKLTGVSRQTISEIERDEYKMSWNQFCSFLVVFSLNKKSNEILHNAGLDMKCVSQFISQTNNSSINKENLNIEFSK